MNLAEIKWEPEYTIALFISPVHLAQAWTLNNENLPDIFS